MARAPIHKGSPTQLGRVEEIRGRRVRVRAESGADVVCFRKGLDVVVGDRVRFEEVPGEGGRVAEVLERRNRLARADGRGNEELLAANLGGLLIVQSASNPGFRGALLDRYLVCAHVEELPVAIVLNKCDLGVPDDVDEALERREETAIFRVSAEDGRGIEALRAFVASAGGPCALVGGSGVGKTSLVGALLPGEDVGAIGEISEYWDTGRHTTTGARLFALPSGGELVDSPGIRNLTPMVSDPVVLRDHFPAVRDVVCAYRDCLHRAGEEGCVLEDRLHPELIDSYRTLLGEIEGRRARQYR